VGKDCPEEEKSEHIEVEAVPTEDLQVETSVVTIDENGTAEETTIEEALEEAIHTSSVKTRTFNSCSNVSNFFSIV
jgi:hypothetical protein